MTATTAPETPVQAETRARRRKLWFWALLAVFLVGTYLFWRIVPEPAEEYSDIREHYKYGSTGGDNSERGVPYRLWKVLPEMFPEHLPGGGRAGTGYDAFGMIVEPGTDRPIGFSKRRVLGLDLVGMNCAICHTGSVRATPESQRQIVLGMPSNTVDLQAYFRFLFACALDERFTEDAVMGRIRAQGDLDPYERLAYPRAVRLFREKLLAQKQKVDYWDRPEFPRFGSGRIDTFNSVKVLSFDWGPGDAVGTNDFPSIWNQRPRRAMSMHWDGNNGKMEERNISAAIGVGVQAPNSAHPNVRSTLDEPSMNRIAEWILDLAPPKFPESRIDRSKVPRGAQVFRDQCARCHAPDGSEIGRVVPITDPQLGTDRQRLDSFTPELSDAMNTIGIGYPWRFQNFRKTNGYANQLIDGIWLRGPYLHNGSVPTLRDLLKPPAERPVKFWRGNDVYDWTNVGFDSTTPAEGARAYFEFDTTLRGNSNAGHNYGTGLSPADKDALVEYLKTF
jgi:mono/diheme cytochrome c family protein